MPKSDASKMTHAEELAELKEREYLDTKEICRLFPFSVSWLTKNRVFGGPDVVPHIAVGRKIIYHVPTVREHLAARARRTTSDTDGGRHE